VIDIDSPAAPVEQGSAQLVNVTLQF